MSVYVQCFFTQCMVRQAEVIGPSVVYSFAQTSTLFAVNTTYVLCQ